MENKEEILPSWYRREDEDDLSYSKFDSYRRMAPSERNITELCRQLGKHENSSHIRKIAKKYNWVERARDWDNHVTATKDKALLDQASEIKVEQAEGARAVRVFLLKPVEEAWRRFREDPAFFKKMSDKDLIKFVGNLPDKLKRIQEVELTAYGHASEITKNDVDVTSEGKQLVIKISDE